MGRIGSNHWTGMSYVHSFGVTKNYIVFLEQALTLSVYKFITGIFTNAPYSDVLVMKKDFNTRIHLIDKRTGKNVCQKNGQSFVTVPLFLFHHINAYETYDSENRLSEIHVDVVAYDPAKFDIKAFTYENVFTEKLCNSESIRSRQITISHKFPTKTHK